MRKKQFIRLLQKYRQGQATKEECRFIESYYDLFETEPGMEAGLSEEEKEQLKKVIEGRIRKELKDPGVQKSGIKKLPTYIMRIAAAVVLLIVAGITTYYLLHNDNATARFAKSKTPPVRTNEIHPGGNTAVLTLGNGKKVRLDSVSGGALAQNGFINISNNSGELVYSSGRKSTKKATQRTTYNTITTPYGGEYKVVLADGTKVWLNAGSSLRYPVAFDGDKRRVTLSGEAYFDVAQKADQPFVVEVDSLIIKVLGTHFNVSAYKESGEISTTLAEGAIVVSKGNKSRRLYPGEQAVLDKQSNELSVEKVNVEEMLAWKNELFYFSNTSIRTIMLKLSRWYNIKVRYTTKFPDKESFSGVMSRYSDVKEILKRMELTGTIHFKVEGKTVTVME